MGADTPHEDYFASKLSVASYAERQRHKSAQKFALMHQPQPFGSSKHPTRSINNYQRNAMKPMGLPTQVFRRSELQAGDHARLQIENFRLLASYSWTASVGPTIIVPGAPREWIGPSFPFKVIADRETYSEDYDRVKSGKDVFSPLFAALAVMQPSYSLSDVFIVCDGTCIEKLFSFAAGEDRTTIWKIECQLINNTLFMNRIDKPPHLGIDLFDGNYFGKGYRDTATQYQENCQESISHHRVVEYSFGHMKFVVRWPADAYAVGLPGGTYEESEEETRAKLWKNRGVMPLPKESLNGIFVVRRGVVVKPSAMVDFPAEFSNKDKDSWVFSRKRAQYYFSKTEQLFKGYHRNGNFVKVLHIELGEKISAWEEEHQEDFAKMMEFIRAVRRYAVTKRVRKFYLLYRGVIDGEDEKVELFDSEADPVHFSRELREWFWGRKTGAAST